MPVESILEVARGGMQYERLRLDAASRNIAGANVPVARGGDATQWRVDATADFGAGFAGMAGASPAQAAGALSERPIGVREVHDPGHPLADAQGMVRYPAVDMVGEMTEMMTASHGYEANVRSFNLLRGMLLRALEIGAK